MTARGAADSVELLAESWLDEPIETDAESERAFEAYARHLTARNTRLVAIGSLIVSIVVWPTDFLIFSWGSDVLKGFMGFRVAMLVLSLLYLGALWLPLGRRHADLVGLFFVTMLSGALGLTLGPLWKVPGGLDQPWLYTTYLVPLFTLAMAWPRVKRTVATLGMSAACVIVFIVVCPDFPFWRLYGPIGLLILLFSAILSVLLGNIMYRVVRVNFFQRRALAERAQALEELDRLKSDFFANVSHELRTPLTLILAALRTLQSTSDGRRVSPEQRRKAAETGLRNASRLLLLINDILELSRLESGQSQLKTDVYDIVELARVVFDSFQQGPELEITTEGPVVARVDGPRIKDVIYNLVSNALKFVDAETGRVDVAIAQEGDEVVIRVTDNGSGIAAADLPHIFDRFYRGHDSQRSELGTGIGLAYVKQVVELHDGTTSVDSTVGRGSEFTIRLPRGDVGARTAEPATSKGSLGDFLRSKARPTPLPGEPLVDDEQGSAPPDAPLVLVADDHPDLRSYVGQLLSGEYRTELAADGVEALELARQLGPDLILADVSMPNMTGPELLQAVRAEPQLAATPFIFLTASATTDFQAEALEAGADDYLIKPFEERELRARVRNLVELKRSRDHLTRLVGSLQRMNEQMAEQLRVKGDDLGVLIGELDTIRDEERGRLAREVHDQMGELVTGMRLGVLLAQQRAGEPDATLEALASLDELLDQSLDALDRTVHGLRPQKIVELGLLGSVEWLVEQFERRYTVAVNLSNLTDDADVSLPAATAEHVFRIVQESLTNVARHAGASSVDVSLAVNDGQLVVSVSDDGVGMADPEAETERRGLIGMRERAALIDAHLAIDSSPGEGTTVRLEVPISN